MKSGGRQDRPCIFLILSETVFKEKHGVLDHRVHTEWQRPLSGVHSIMMEKLAQAVEGGVGGALFLPSQTKLRCTLQLRGQKPTPYFISTPIKSA